MKRKTTMYSIAGAGFLMAMGMGITSYAATGWQKEGDDWV